MGAGLARDAGNSVYQVNRGDAIAEKPSSHTSSLPQGNSVFSSVQILARSTLSGSASPRSTLAATASINPLSS